MSDAEASEVNESDVQAEGWVCPVPLRDYPNIVMGHGGGGKLSADLVEHLFVPQFSNPALDILSDQAVLDVPGLDGARLAFTTDSFVVSPLFFPGGDIGSLAVHGTINDLAMSGARPLFLSAGYIVEEGLPIDTLGRVATSMAAAARQADVQIVTGDTKVVDKGHGDGLFVNTSGIGLVPEGVNIGPDQARPGDAVIVSGEIGLHGVTILSVREGLGFETAIQSDSAPLHGLVAAMLDTSTGIRSLRDPTRGGLASTLNEFAKGSGVGIEISEASVPVPAAVNAACEMLGLDPFYVANEGKLAAIVPGSEAEAVLATMRTHPLGQAAAIIGHVTEDHPGIVVAQTGIGGRRIIDTLVGDQLPRIC